MRFFALLLALLCASPAVAGEELQVVQGVFCDTKDQAVAFASTWNGLNTQEVLDGINRVEGDHACLIAKATVSVTGRYETYRTPAGSYQIVQITVVALWFRQGVYELPAPVTWYSGLPVREQTAALPMNSGQA